MDGSSLGAPETRDDDAVAARWLGVRPAFQFDDDGDISCRQITANDDDGSFYDLDAHVANAEVTTGHRVRAITMPDIHVRKIDGPLCRLREWKIA